MSFGTLRGRSRVSVGLEWTSSIVSFSTSSLWKATRQHGFLSHLRKAPGALSWLHTHQLDVVDALVSELLQGSLGAVLQGEGQALQRLLLAVHADLRLHLQREAKPHKLQDDGPIL